MRPWGQQFKQGRINNTGNTPIQGICRIFEIDYNTLTLDSVDSVTVVSEFRNELRHHHRFITVIGIIGLAIIVDTITYFLFVFSPLSPTLNSRFVDCSGFFFRPQTSDLFLSPLPHPDTI